MKIEGISMECTTTAEALDALEEMRYLFDAADDGVLDLGPALRSLMRNAYWAIDAQLAHADVPAS